ANNTAGNLIGFFLGGGMRAFLPDAKPKAKPKFQHLADKDAKINRWTGQPHNNLRPYARYYGIPYKAVYSK
ncbi:hypothetical protein VJI77_07740, partial [Parvimonas sp. D2]